MISYLLRRGSHVVRIILFISFCNAVLAEVEIYGEASYENRYFVEEGLFGQDKNHSSFTLSPEFYFESEDQKTSFTFKPKIRRDSVDNERNLFDIQDFSYWVY